MKHAVQCLVGLTCVVSLIFSISGCSSGGGEGSPPSPPVSTTTQAVVSGTVQAPGGQLAFFKRKSFRDLFISEAYAALTGVANVPDNTIVQLARLNANASSFSVISTTSTAGGLYSFNLTALGLQPANDLIVRVAGSGGKEMRAFVVGTVADISPISEAAYQLAVQSLNGGPLSNLTLQEVSDISGAVGLIGTLQNLGTATTIGQAVGLVKAAVGTNTQLTGFLAATGANGQTTQGTGDIGNFYPFELGSIWRYKGIRQVSGSVREYENTVTVSGQGPAPGHGVSSTIFSESNAEGEGQSENNYGVKGLSGITSYGNDDPGDNLTRQLTPFHVVHFPLTIGTTVLLGERNELNWGQDEDGDGRNESFNAQFSQTALALEPMTVEAASFPTTMRIEVKAAFVVHFTQGGSATIVQTNTAWHVPGVGRIKEIVEARLEDGPVQASLTEELTSYVVNGQGGGFRIEVVPASSSVTLGGTIQLTAQVFDNSRLVRDFPVTWSSSNGSIVGVDGTGLVSGQSLGQASVRATVGSIISNLVPITVQDIRSINLETSALIYDSSRQRIYASVPSGASENPDRILVINPETGAVTRTIFVGDDPDKLAISDDFRYLYVSVKGAATSVRRINLSNNQVDQSFSVGTNIVAGQLRVDDMEVIPGSPQSLVVARMYPGISPRHAGVAVFDNGVQRPDVGPLGESKNDLEFGTTATRLYGADREGSGNNSIMNIGPSGVTLVGIGCCSFDGQFDAGFIFSKNGQIIDPELKQVVGFLPGISPLNHRNDDLIRVAPSRNRIYFLKALDGGMRLLAFDRTSLQQIASADLFPPFIALASPTTHLTLWGSEGLAFRDGSRKLILLRTSILQ